MEDIKNRILYEDNHYLVINKRCGEIVQGDKSGDLPLTELAASFLVKRDQKPGNAFIGLTHRIDRPTSGALILAKTSKGLSRMNELFRLGEVDKTYWAIIQGIPEVSSALWTHWLVKDSKKNKSRAYSKAAPGRKEAKMSWTLLLSSDRYSLLEIKLLTGRHHQIRAQLAAQGFYIRGDLKYGAKRSNPDGGISLHCRSLAFQHPIKNIPLKIDAPVPKEDSLWHWFETEQEGLEI